MSRSKAELSRIEKMREKIITLYNNNGGNISAVARELGVTRSSVQAHLRKLGGVKRPLVAGKKEAVEPIHAEIPSKGEVRRYIVTSAQNNTRVNQKFFADLMALKAHYEKTGICDLLIGTFSYNQNAFGELAVKAGTSKPKEESLWFDPLVREFVVDRRVQLAPGLVWCGEMNILPTAEDPLSGLETYSHRQSAIFPHTKLSMRSIATMQGEGAKLNFTTGTVTERNYIQKKAGLKAEHHHRYSALLVEVNGEGEWWVRQVGSSSDGKKGIQDLNVEVKDGRVVSTTENVEAITLGDLHATIIDPKAHESSMTMLDQLRPNFLFLHDIMEGVSISHHNFKNPHAKFKAFIRGLQSVEIELTKTGEVVKKYLRPGQSTVVVNSNHDEPWLIKWLAEHDYRIDPLNAEFFLDAQKSFYKLLRAKVEGNTKPLMELFEWAIRRQSTGLENVRFLKEDESFTICDKKIECGMHGHLGPNGARGNPKGLSKIGRRANTAHTHSAGIFNGLYVAGTSSRLQWDYARGPSSWTHSHIITYPNGQRSVVTVWKGRWRA